MKLKLIEGWKKAFKMWSVLISSFGALVMGVFTIWPDSAFIVWQSMPDEAKAAIPQNLVSIIALFLFVMTAFARIIKQKQLENKTLIVDGLTKEEVISGEKLKEALKDGELQ